MNRKSTTKSSKPSISHSNSFVSSKQNSKQSQTKTPAQQQRSASLASLIFGTNKEPSRQRDVSFASTLPNQKSLSFGFSPSQKQSKPTSLTVKPSSSSKRRLSEAVHILSPKPETSVCYQFGNLEPQASPYPETLQKSSASLSFTNGGALQNIQTKPKPTFGSFTETSEPNLIESNTHDDVLVEREDKPVEMNIPEDNLHFTPPHDQGIHPHHPATHSEHYIPAYTANSSYMPPMSHPMMMASPSFGQPHYSYRQPPKTPHFIPPSSLTPPHAPIPSSPNPRPRERINSHTEQPAGHMIMTGIPQVPGSSNPHIPMGPVPANWSPQYSLYPFDPNHHRPQPHPYHIPSYYSVPVMLPSNPTRLNSNAKVFTPPDKKSKALKIIDPNTKKELTFETSSNKPEASEKTSSSVPSTETTPEVPFKVPGEKKVIPIVKPGQTSEPTVEPVFSKPEVIEVTLDSDVEEPSKESIELELETEVSHLDITEEVAEKKSDEVIQSTLVNSETTPSLIESEPVEEKIEIVGSKIEEVVLETKEDSIKEPKPSEPEDLELTKTKLRYSREFLLKFKDLCTEKPPKLDLPIFNEDTRENEAGPRMRKAPSSRGRGYEMGHFKSVPKTSEERFSMSSRELSHRSSSYRHGMRDGGGRGSRRGRKGPIPSPEPAITLRQTENRWVPRTLVSTKSNEDKDKEYVEEVHRKVKGLLNKLTLEKFDTLSDKIIEWGNKSVDETDGRTLKLVIQLIFDKATDEPNFSQIYSRLCAKFHEKLDPEVQDANFLDKNQNVVKGGALFRKYLLNRCQEEFEQGWKTNVPISTGVQEMMSDEYYLAVKAKRRGLGLVQFIGELFKLGMLTENIMHGCIVKLFKTQQPEEEEIESLCKLLSTIGKNLDHPAARYHMDLYFDRIRAFSKTEALSSRIRFMLKDLVELRSRKWIPRREVTGPKTLAEIEKDQIRKKEEAELALRKSTSSMGRNYTPQSMKRNPSDRKDSRHRNFQQDRWKTSSRHQNDLKSFGQFRNQSTNSDIQLGPVKGSSLSSGARGWNTDKKEKPSNTRSSSLIGSNLYDALLNEPSKENSTENHEQPTKILQRPSTRDKSPEPEPSNKPSLSEEQVIKKIQSIFAEFLNIHDFNEAILCVQELESPQYHHLVFAQISQLAFEKKREEIELTSQLLGKLSQKNIITPEDIQRGLPDLNPILDDLSIDNPRICSFAAPLFTQLDVSLDSLKESMEPDQPVVRLLNEVAKIKSS